MRIERAIDAFLDWRRIERDATPRSIDSYWRILVKLAGEYPEIQLSELTTEDLRRFLRRWSDKSAATRSNVISVLHSFFRWAESEDLVEHDPHARSETAKAKTGHLPTEPVRARANPSGCTAAREGCRPAHGGRGTTPI